jgi:hypothetical protein
LLLLGALPWAARGQEQTTAEPRPVTLRGRVVCVTEEFGRLYQATPDCAHRGHVYGLQTAEGKLYPFLPTDAAAAIPGPCVCCQEPVEFRETPAETGNDP